MLKFIFKTTKEEASKYYKNFSEEFFSKISNYDIYGIYDKNNAKGFKKLIGQEPEYGFKGELKVRIKRTEKTDVIKMFIMKQSKKFKHEFIKDFEGFIKNKIYSEKVENISAIFERFNPILKVLLNEEELKKELKEIDLINSIKNICPTPSEAIQELLDML